MAETKGPKHTPGHREGARPSQDGHRLRGERQDAEDHRRRAGRSRKSHPLYGKIIRTTTKVKAHDENGDAGIGDRVSLMETRPTSATKRWRLVEILERAK
jgi:small subunit ribosomal protein S17